MNQYRQYIYWALGFTALVAIFYFFSDILTWIILAWVVSLLGSPMMNVLGKIKVGKRRMSASVRAAITLVTFFLVFVLFIALFVPVIIQQGNNLAKVNYSQVIAGLEEPINHLYKRLSKLGMVDDFSKQALEDSTNNVNQKDSLQNQSDSSGNIKVIVPISQTSVSVQSINIDSLIKKGGDTTARTNIQLLIRVENSGSDPNDLDQIHDSTAIVTANDSPVERVQKQIFSYFNPSSVLRNTLSTIWGLVGNLFVLLTSVLFIAFFFLQEEGMFSKLVKAPFPEKQGDHIDRALYLIKSMLIRYFEGILVQMSVLALYLWLLLTLVGAENALLIAFFGAIVNVIPYIGPFIGMAFALIVSVCSSLDLDFYTQTMPLLLRVVLVFFSMQAIDNLFLQPMIFSKSVKAHPIEIFVVIVIGSKLAGMVGMVVAIPFYTALRVIASIFLSEFKIVQHLTAQLGIKLQWMKGRRNSVSPPKERYNNKDSWGKGGWRTKEGERTK
jgi:predicted PurR-regulated permease PerM